MSILKELVQGQEDIAQVDRATLSLKEQLLFYVRLKNKAEFLAFLKRDFTTDEKKTLQKELKRLYRYFNESREVKINGINHWKQGWDELHDNAQEWMYVAALRFYNRRDMRTLWRKYLDSDLTKELFKTHVPGWFAGYVEDELGGEWAGISFQEVYQYYQDGIIPKPQPENYIRSLSNLSTDYKWERKNEGKSYIYNYVMEHPDIIKEDMNLFFEYPHNAHNHDNYLKDHKQWRFVILRLIKEKHLNAETIVQKNLHALQLGFNRAQDSWQKKMYESIVTEYDCETALQEDLINLLANANPQNVSFAIKRLKVIQKNKQLDDAAFMEAAPSLFYQESKTTVKNCIQILSNIAKTNKDLSASICTIAAEGLMHEDGDIQKRTATLLIKYGASNQETLQDIIAPYTPTLHTQAKEVLKDYITEEGIEEEEYIPTPTLSKLDESLVVTPVKDVDELLFLGHQILELKEEDPLSLERFFAGFVKFKKEIAEQPDRIKPLNDRSKKRADSWSEMSTSGFILMSFILHYFEEDLSKFSRFNHRKNKLLSLDGVLPFVEHRIHKIFQLCNSEVEATLLSTPTHAPYWIDPVILVERLLAQQATNQNTSKFDFILAMARVAFEEEAVAAALEKSKALKGEKGDVIRFLLSGKLDGKIMTRAFWLNAARTREPQGDFSAWAGRWELPTTPDLIKAPEYSTRVEVSKSRYSNQTYTYTNQHIDKSLRLSRKHYVDKHWLYVQLHGNMGWQNRNLLHAYVPNNPEAIFAENAIDVNVFLEPSLTMLPMAQSSLADFMIVENKVDRQVAHEAFIIQAEAQKLDYDWMGKELGKWIAAGYVKMNRLLEGLKFIADTSSFHGKAISQLIRAIVPELGEELPRNSKKLFEIWYDLLAKSKDTANLVAMNPNTEAWMKKGAAKAIVNKICKLQ